MRNILLSLFCAVLLSQPILADGPVRIGDGQGNILALTPDGSLPVANVATKIFYDAFETTFDTVNNWSAPVSAGGGVGESWSAGQITLGTGTTANGYASVATQHAFQPVPPGYLEVVKAIKLPATIPANTEAYWGLGTAAAVPTAAIPVTEGCGFEIQAAATSALEKMYVTCFAGSVRTVIQDLSASTGNGTQPLDGTTHTYYMFFRGDFYYFCIDRLTNVVAIQKTGVNGPNVNTQPMFIGAVAGTIAPLSSLTITVAAVWAGDTGRNGVSVCDATNPWRCQAVSATGGSSVVTSPIAASAFTEAQVTFSSSGNNAAVAAVSAKTTKLYRLTLSCQGITAITIQDGSTAKLGPYYLGAGGSVVLDYDPSGSPWMVGTANTALNINSSNAVSCGGSISYIQS